MKKRDIILFGIVGILIVQGVLINKFMNSGQGARVEVYVENKLYNTYPLDKDQKINIKIISDDDSQLDKDVIVK